MPHPTNAVREAPSHLQPGIAIHFELPLASHDRFGPAHLQVVYLLWQLHRQQAARR